MLKKAMLLLGGLAAPALSAVAETPAAVPTGVGSSTLPYIIGGIALVLVVGLIILTIVTKKKK